MIEREEFDPLIDTNEVCAMRSRSRTDLHNAIKAGRFPPGIKLGMRTVRWPLSVVLEAIRKEIAEAQKLNDERAAAMTSYAQRGVAKRRELREAKEVLKQERKVIVNNRFRENLVSARSDCTKKTINPTPKGTIKPGGITDRVLKFMEQRKSQQLEPKEIISGLNSSHSAVSWALRFLEANGHICSFDHPTRKIYRVYQAI
jgi:predicted DNA-binding transcriptional regulator AlpA